MPVAAVNMPEDVQPRFDFRYGLCQFLTSQMRSARMRLIENSKRWAVCYKDVRALRNHLPVTPDGRATIDVEGPVIEGRLGG